MQGSVKALTDVLALAAPAVFGQGARLKDIVAALAAETGWNEAWEIEVAALLAQVGAITLPDETAEKLYSGGALSAEEEEMASRVPTVTEQILGNIPRLEGVMQILKHYPRRFDSVQADGMLPVGARMLRIGIDFLALEREDPSPLLALETMRGRAGIYDPDLLEAFARTVGIGDRRIIVVEMAVRDLREGMTLVSDPPRRVGPTADRARAPRHPRADRALAQLPGRPRARAAPRDQAGMTRSTAAGLFLLTEDPESGPRD